MASDVEICNAALQKLGADRITALDDDTQRARECNACYARLRDKELSAHIWLFATKRAQLPESADTPAFGPAHAYPVPDDFLRLAPPDPENVAGSGLSIPGTLVTFGTSLDWRIENHGDILCILTSEGAPLNVRYVAQITDPNIMHPLFREALACLMAMEMCERLTQSNVKKADARQAYKDAIAEARRVNALQSTPVESADGSWISGRA